MNNDHAQEFQQRRSDIFRESRLWALGLFPLFVLLPFCVFTSIISFPIPIAVLILLALPAFYSAYRITTLIRTRYKCPNCEQVVTEVDGIALNPVNCPHCNAKLK